MEKAYAEFVRKAQDFFLVTEKEFIYIVILTSSFTFLSFIGHIRSELTEPAGFYVSYYGFPFEWFKMRSNLSYSWYTVTKLEILWVGFLLDLVLYILLSLVLVRVAEKFVK